MPTTRSTTPAATSPEKLHAALEDVFGRGDLDAFVALHAPDATVRTPPEGQVVHGLDAVRAATAPILALRPKLTSTVLGVVEGDGLALSHARWELRATAPDGSPVHLHGRGTIVSRRQADGTWRIVFDDPLTPTA
jgi:uncharacterized protein (TIGR02246 family)